MPGQPYVSPLPDGRYLAVELPPESTATDEVTGELLLLPPAIRLLERLRALTTPLPPLPTKNRLRILREALSLDKEELAERLSATVTEVEQWETGATVPPIERLSAYETLRSQAARNGVILGPMAKAS